VAFHLQTADKAQLGKWDPMVRDFDGGTLFHERDFLGYHGDRFGDDERFLVITKGEAVVGLLPALIMDGPAGKRIVSPYGGSFGGPIFKSTLVLKDAVEIMQLYQDYFKSEGIATVQITLSPSEYSTNTDLLEYCLLRNGYSVSKADLFNIVAIRETPEKVRDAYEGRVRTTLRKEADQFMLREDADVASFYSILQVDKTEKNTAPTHRLEDLVYLKEKYPDRIRIDIATHKETGAGFGICYFKVNKYGWMTFYMAQDKKELRLNGITVLLNEFLCAMAGKYAFLDFGGSTFGYEISNPGIANFKEGFGASSRLRKTFKCDLHHG
jgi:hypothetical protein